MTDAIGKLAEELLNLPEDEWRRLNELRLANPTEAAEADSASEVISKVGAGGTAQDA